MQVLFNFLFEDNYLVHKAIRKADRCFAAARLLIPKACRKYGLLQDPEFLPSPIVFAEHVQKSETPLVCFVGRLDRRKRPQVFFDLAEQFPEVRFEAVGAGRDTQWEHQLRSKYGHLQNLNIRGFVDQFEGNELSDLLGKSWVLVNTSVREGLPTSFIEAAGHGCAILSGIDPDGFASMFGYLVKEDDYRAGLQYLLENHRWQTQGENGMAYVRKHYNVTISLEKHIEAYWELLR
jgi:glycosyltransferase involved in cell wall biosynthesis